MSRSSIPSQDLPPSEELFHSLIECSFEGLMVYSVGKIIYANRAFASMFGYSTSEITGMKTTDLLPTEVEEHGDEESETYETIGLKKDGVSFSVEIVTRRHFHEGRVSRVAAIRDISRRRQFEKKIRHVQKLEAVGQLAASVAHEINNPLTYILLQLESLKTEGIAPGRIDEIIGGVERIRTIVADLKMFSRKDDDPPEAVDLSEAITKAIQIASNEIRHRARLVEDHGVVPPVKGNAMRLTQVFINLLINAAHAIEEQSDPSRGVIHVRTFTENGWGILEVRDTGPGISAEYLQKIFEPFFTTKPLGMGTGLGLSICRSIVESYGGKIDVSTGLGAGTSFLVKLPLYDLPLLPLHPIAGIEAKPVSTATEIGSSGAAVGRILVIDDEEPIRSSIARTLCPPHDVIVAANGTEALLILEQNSRFDLILCDVMMPEHSGAEFYNAVKARRPEILDRIAFMTGGAFTGEARNFLESVPNPRLAKPFRSRHLIELVNRFV